MEMEDDGYRLHEDSCSGVYPDQTFEGLWIEHWPNGNVKFRGHYKRNQRRVGQHICFYQNGVLQELSCWDEGYACGTLIWFREDGSKEVERDYGEYGGRIRSWTERSYSLDGELYTIYVWKEDKIIAEWTRPDLRKIEAEIGLDRIVEDAANSVYPKEASETGDK